MSDWTARLGFGPQLERYAPGRFAYGDLVGSDVRFVARPCLDYYRFWDRGWVRWIDEPTNEVFLEALNKRHLAVGVNFFHPKIVLGSDSEGPANHAVHTNLGLRDLNAKFTLLQLTKDFVAPSLYVDKILPLTDGRLGSLEYRAGFGLGVYVGYARSETPEQGVVDERLSAIGGFATLRQGLIYTEPSGHLSLGANLDLTRGWLDYALLGQRASQEVSAYKVGVHVAVQF